MTQVLLTNTIRKNFFDMNVLNERKFYQQIDKSFRITAFVRKFIFLEFITQKIVNILCTVLRKLIFPASNKTGSILIISIHRLGDTVFTIPAITQLFKNYYNYKIKILCYEETKAILALKFERESIITIKKNDFFFGRRLAKSYLRKLVRSIKPEIIFDLTGQITSASMIFSSKADKIIGVNKIYFKNIYDKFIDVESTKHYINRYLDVVRLDLPIPGSSEINFFQPKEIINSKILIHPFAIRKAKEWNLKRYIDLADDLKKDFDVEIVCPPNFIPQDIIKEITSREIPFEETVNIEHLIDKIKKCSLFISNDSGPIYIASLLGVATFTIYGSTNPSFTLPFGKNHRFIRKLMSCSASEKESSCFTYAGIFCPSTECFESISLELVKSEIYSFSKDLGLKK